MARSLCLSLVLLLFGVVPCRAAEPTNAWPVWISSADSQASSPVTTPSASQVQAYPSPAEHSAANDLLSEAQSLYRKGNFDQAIQKYRQVLHESPSSAEAYAGLTRVYLKKKDVDQADATVAAGLKAANAPILHVVLGEVYFRQGNLAEAEWEWVTVISSGDEDARAYMGMARLRWALSMYKSGWALTSLTRRTS